MKDLARDFVTEPSQAEPKVSALRASVSRAAKRRSSVLFLDVDGVLNCKRTFMQRGEPIWRVDAEKVALLNEVARRTGCRVVISSTWRKGKFQGPEGCRAILRARGVKVRFPRDWRTPGSRDGIRGGEIADWLKRNGSPAYAIVDDDSDMLPEQMPRFVQTSFEIGLTRQHADRLISLLAPAQGMEAGTAETKGLGLKDDSPVSEADAPDLNPNPQSQTDEVSA